MIRRHSRAAVALVSLAGAALTLNVFAHLGHPLLWSDEASTAVFGQRVLIYGYPKVHHEGSAYCPINLPLETARKESIDAFIGIPWAHFYVAALGELVARRAADEPYERTARLRAPFATAGVVGVLLFAVALAPAAAAGPGRAGFVAAHLILATLSTSLVLHLREVRYYPLVVLEIGLLFAVHLWHTAYRRIGRRAHDVLVAAILIASFLTFYPVCVAAAAALVVDSACGACRTRGPWRARLRAGAVGVVPVAVASVGIAPLLVFFETLHVAAAFSARLHFSWATFGENVRALLWHLLRYDALVPTVLCQAAWSLAPHPRDHLDGVGRRAVVFAWTFVIVHAAVAAYNPVLWGRYFVALTPVLLGIACVAAAQAIRHRNERPRPARIVQASLVAASLSLFVALQWPLLAGRFAEIREPVQGPLDFAIPFIRERYEHPEDIVVATNYEAPSFMYYLGCKTAEVSGPGDASPPAAVEPHVVVPRRWWGAAGLQHYLLGRHWFEQRFPVEDVPFNNIPETTNVSRRLTVLHHFRTPIAADSATQFRLYWRSQVASAKQ